ncbi:hypothetical protein [uncultured Cocleimonas sp.]|uniref:hypothetical protein n=1 Tax=uncultured Cocleimonas sp. TaxID=1051587 RepID=UPI00263751AA|nr:hypothetical protein [uncultured Cocleimonas sp.]
MLGICDIEGMSGCTEEVIDAIAIHERVSDTVACQIAFDFINSHGGVPRLRRIIKKDIEMAENLGDLEQVKKLKGVLERFLMTQRKYYQGTVASLKH